MKKRIATCLLSLLLVFSACSGGGENSSSGNNNNNNTPVGNGEVEIWTTYATEKVLQDRTDIYDDVRMPASLSVEACKGEYEGAQVIMTAISDVEYYTAEITSNLVSATGEVFSKENVSLYHQKYMKVDEAYFNGNSPVAGMYPDALLPLETAIAFEENKVKKGENQGIYLTFNVPVDQAAGMYQGNLKITYDQKTSNLPIYLMVYDLTVSQETRSMSYFNLGFSQYLGELDGTQNIWRTYVEEMIKYRLAPGSVVMQSSANEQSLQKTIDEIADLVINYGLSTVSIPGGWRTGGNLTTFLTRLAEKSIELNYNLLDRVIVKGTDEPKVYQLDKVKNETIEFNNGINAAVAKIGSLKGASSEFLEELKQSVKKIPHIITLNYQRNDETNAIKIDTYCPFFSSWHTESDRALYGDQWKGRWWYGCSGPMPPYPSYHLDDTLVSARAISWMMGEYDIVGNLYWSMTVYAEYDGVKYSPIDDYYTGKADRYPKSNGDGYLFYPGAPYGIDGPIPSIRLQAIRDGNEEYEIIYDVKKDYEAAGYSFADIERTISELIYTGTIVRYEENSAYFAQARRALINLAMLAKKGVFVTDVEKDQIGNVTFTIVANKDYKLKVAGNLIEGVTEGENKKYTISIALSETKNNLDLTVETAEESYKLFVFVGGKIDYLEANELYSSNLFSDRNAKATVTLDGDKITLKVGAVNSQHQNVRSSIFNNVGKNVQKLVIEVENPSEEDISIRILARYSNQSLGTEWYNGRIKPGTNLIEVDFSGMQIGDAIEYSDFYFSEEPGNHSEKTININSMTVYYK